MGLTDFLLRLFAGKQGEPLPQGTPAPTFTLQDINGRAHSLDEARRQGPVLLAFFKESCPTCQFTLPFLERLHQEIKDHPGVRLWGVSQDEPDEARAFAQEYGLSFPLLVDEDGYRVSNAYELTNVPTLVLVTPAGEVQLSSIGFDRADLESVAEEFSRRIDRPIQLFRPDEKIPDHRPG